MSADSSLEFPEGHVIPLDNSSLVLENSRSYLTDKGIISAKKQDDNGLKIGINGKEAKFSKPELFFKTINFSQPKNSNNVLESKRVTLRNEIKQLQGGCTRGINRSIIGNWIRLFLSHIPLINKLAGIIFMKDD